MWLEWKDSLAADRGSGDDLRKLLLLCVSVCVSLRSAVVLLWDFPGGFD